MVFCVCLCYFPGGLDDKESACDVRDPGSTSGAGNDNPPQYCCLENPTNRGAWWATVCGVTESRAWVSISISLSRWFLAIVLICILIRFQDVEAFHVIFKRTVWVKLTSGAWPLDPLPCFEFFFQDLPSTSVEERCFFPYRPAGLVRTRPSAQVFPLLLQKRKAVAFLHAPLVGFVFGNWCPFHYRGLEYKSRKSRNTWSNRQIWPWNVEWSRAKTNRVLPRERTCHSKHPLPRTQEKTLHTDITRWSTQIRLIIFFAAKDGEAVYSQQKQDTELTVAQFMNSLLPIQTQTEESKENG